MFVVIVCGDRDYDRSVMVNAWLNGLYSQYGDDLKIKQGGARGADLLAKEWCRQTWGSYHYRDHMSEYMAEWDVYGNAAGHLRNREMLEDGPTNLVLGFKDNFNWKMDKGGTENMIKIAKEANVPAFVIQKAV